MDLPRHAAALFEASHSREPERLFRYLPDGPFADPSEFAAHLRGVGRTPARADVCFGRTIFWPRLWIGELYADRPAESLPRGRLCVVRAVGAANHRADRGDVPDGAARVRGSRVPPLRMEMRQPQRRVACGCTEAWLHLRGGVPPAHDRARPQSRHGLVLHARRGVARSGAPLSNAGWRRTISTPTAGSAAGLRPGPEIERI